MSKRQELLKKTVERGKYFPLYAFLQKYTKDEWRIKFSELEKVLGFPLPDSARIHRPWWANAGENGGHSHALAWEMAGWKTSQVDLVGENLIFIRK